MVEKVMLWVLCVLCVGLFIAMIFSLLIQG